MPLLQFIIAEGATCYRQSPSSISPWIGSWVCQQVQGEGLVHLDWGQVVVRQLVGTTIHLLFMLIHLCVAKVGEYR